MKHNDNNEKNIRKLLKNLYLLYEFEEPNKFPSKFISGLEVVENTEISTRKETINSELKIIHKGRIKDIKKKNEPIEHIWKFQKEFIHRNVNGSFIFRPQNLVFSSLFELIMQISKNYSIEEIFDSFSWQEFEEFITSALNYYGFFAFRTFRYSYNKKRYEIDVIARDKQRILLIDAKNWKSKTLNISALKKAGEDQYIRSIDLVKDANIFKKLLEKLSYNDEKFYSFNIFPIILTSNKVNSSFSKGESIPIISFSNFNEFLNNFTAYKSNYKSIEMSNTSFREKRE